MNTLLNATWRAAVMGRWTARIVGTLMALFFLVFLLGEGPPPLLRLTWQQSVQFLGMAGLFAGLLLAWKWEGWGGIVALASFGLLLGIDRRFNTSWLFLLPAATAALHILCWWRLKSGPPPLGTDWELPRKALWTIGIVVGTFILLSANEIFGQPPLMTPALHPSAEMVGHWHATPPAYEVDFIIAADGAVSGRVGHAAISGGRIRNNRTWFGVLMHWREPYEILGDGFTAPLAMRGHELRGALFISAKPYELILRKQ